MPFGRRNGKEEIAQKWDFYVGTCNNPADHFGPGKDAGCEDPYLGEHAKLKALVETGKIISYAVGIEEGGEEETEHYQIAIRWSSKKHARVMIKDFPMTDWSVKFSKSTPAQALGYCMKGAELKYAKKAVENESQSDTEWTFENPSPSFEGDFGGVWPAGQGSRKDIKENVDAIMAGDLTVTDILLDNPEMYTAHGRAMQAAQAARNASIFRTWVTEGIWFWGRSGLGKSARCRYWRVGDEPGGDAWKARHDAGDFDPSITYIVPHCALKSRDFWEGYAGQEIVVFEEFRGNHKEFTELLKLMDNVPLWVDQKGKATVPFMAKLVLFNSVWEPAAAFAGVYTKSQANGTEAWAQWEGRCTEVKLTGTSFRQQAKKPRIEVDTETNVVVDLTDDPVVEAPPAHAPGFRGAN